jgi:transposase InsO family protein
VFACHLFGIDRQIYYRSIRRKAVKKTKAEQVVVLVKEVRVKMPRAGIIKLYHILSPDLLKMNIGRDKFADILRASHLLIIPRRSYHVTTNSQHRFRKHKNLILEMSIVRPEQLWVSDITYIGKRDKPCYLSLITDAYSKKIMGYYVANDLTAGSSVRALKMAIRVRKDKTLTLIHHSDRGFQYCADEYQKVLNKHEIKCCMTNNGDPYENAVAERINGILKQEFNIDNYHADLAIMKKVVKEAVDIYNQVRPHYSNYFLTPNQMHSQCELKMRTYKRKNSIETSLNTV